MNTAQNAAPGTGANGGERAAISPGPHLTQHSCTFWYLGSSASDPDYIVVAGAFPRDAVCADSDPGGGGGGADSSPPNKGTGGAAGAYNPSGVSNGVRLQQIISAKLHRVMVMVTGPAQVDRPRRLAARSALPGLTIRA